MAPAHSPRTDMESNSPGTSLGRASRKSSPMPTNEPSPLVSGTSFKAKLLGNFSQQEVETQAPVLNRVPVREANTRPRTQKLSPLWTGAGFVLMDSSLNPISFNAEAVEILDYP